MKSQSCDHCGLPVKDGNLAQLKTVLKESLELAEVSKLKLKAAKNIAISMGYHTRKLPHTVYTSLDKSFVGLNDGSKEIDRVIRKLKGK
ncbi:MAG: hypothetical protein V3U54_13040 [Thermodesulfobacteriota bacterium]